jgi:tetratricopeptide (TPR) repeat protein
VLIGLAGCAATPQKPAQALPEKPAETAAQAPEQVPATPLSPELLYKLLIAEFAAQDGQLQLSAQAYLKSAEESGDPRLARRATQTAVYARDAATALIAARLWVKLDPEDIDARQSLAALLIRNGQNDEAMPHLKKIITFSPEGKRGHGYQLVASLLARSEDPQQAMQQMEQLTADKPHDPEALYAHAELANQLGENEKARVMLEELLRQQPKRTEALILQARVLHSLGQEEEALKSLQRALKQNPDNDQMRLTYARMLVDARHLKEARRQFRKLNKRLPENSDVIYALGLLALEAGDINDAEPYFMDLVRLGEREEEARFALGQIAQSRDRPQEAIDWYQSVPRGDRYMEAQLMAAKLISEEEGIDQAIDYLQQLPLNSSEERIQRYLAKAELLASQNRYDEAMVTYDEGLAVFSDNTDLLYARALTAEKFGHLDILEQDLKRIIELEPKNAQALNALGYTLADSTDRFEEAHQYIKRALELRPDDPAILDSMGWSLYRLGRYDEAISYLRKALDQLDDAEIAAHLGETLWVSGHKSEARDIWNKAKQSNPDDKVLQETIKRFNP